MSSEITELRARLDRLEAENHRLSAHLEQLTATPTENDDTPIGRRGMLKRTAALALGATAVGAAGQALAATPAAAADGSALILGRTDNTSTSRTWYVANLPGDQATLHVRNSASTAEGYSKGLSGVGEIGVRGTGTTNSGVLGSIGSSAPHPDLKGAGVAGWASRYGVGVLGMSDEGDAVLGRAIGPAPGVGVRGSSTTNQGVVGESTGAGAGVAGYGRGTGSGVYGEATLRNAGVYGLNSGGRGVEGYDDAGGIGVYGHTHLDDYENLGVGVLGISHGRSGQPEDRNGGVIGNSGMAIGVQGLSDDRDGVVGRSSHARGGWFAGGAAAVRLVPGSSATHPTAGETGDLYVDSTGRLWYCKQGGSTATWANLA